MSRGASLGRTPTLCYLAGWLWMWNKHLIHTGNIYDNQDIDFQVCFFDQNIERKSVLRIKGVVHKLAQSTGHEQYCTACKVLRLLVQLWWPGSLFCIPDLSESCLSVTVSRLMWSAEVASLQTWSVLMHSPRPGNAEVMIYFPAMKGTCQQALGHFLPKAGGNPPVGQANKQNRSIWIHIKQNWL